jgi:hypothetical protein
MRVSAPSGPSRWSWPTTSASAPRAQPVGQRARRIAASVWMKKLKSVMPTWVRASAETMPLVTVWPTPKGLPMASTRSPTSTSSESRISRLGRLGPGVDAQHREVGALVVSTSSGIELAAGRPARPVISVGAGDDVVVGDDEAVGGDDHAGAERVLPRARGAPNGRSRPKKRRKNGSSNRCEASAAAAPPCGVDVDHRRRRLLALGLDVAIDELDHRHGAECRRSGSRP